VVGVAADRQAGTAGAHVLHVRCRPGTGEREYRALLGLIRDISPVLQVLPPSAALVDVAGALRYWDASPYDLAQRIRVSALAHLDVDARIGAGPNWTVAAIASKGPLPVTVVTPEQVRGFLDPLPVGMLHGIGPVQERALTSFGLRPVGALAAVPESTVQRILGGRAGRLLRDRARGIDPRPVSPTGLPGATSERRLFDADTLDPGAIRAALLETAVVLGDRLRGCGRIAAGLTLEVAFSGGSTVSRTRQLPEPSHHTDDLRGSLYRMVDALHLQRARVRGITVTAEGLRPAGTAGGQISLERARENRLRAEPVMDEVNARFGAGAVRPATLAWRKAS